MESTQPTGPHAATPAGRPRARAIGIPFSGRPGRWNAITDVPGVQAGYATLVRGDSVRTGVTAVHPRGPQGAGDPVAAGFFSQNGNGEMTGVSWIEESGTFGGPVAITNTHAVGIAHAGIIAWAVRHHPQLADLWLLPVAAETWDGYLNDIAAPNSPWVSSCRPTSVTGRNSCSPASTWASCWPTTTRWLITSPCPPEQARSSRSWPPTRR